MKHPPGHLATRAVGLALALLMVIPAVAAAADFGAPPVSGPITAALPGLALTVDIGLDATTGALSSVSLNPVGDFTATKDRPSAVKFEKADGSVKVTISAWGGNTSIKAKAGTLAALVGAGTWKADLFSTGTKTTVSYTVGDDGTGKPTLKVDSVQPPIAGIAVTIGTPTTKSSDKGSSAQVRIDFAWHGYTKHLSIGVSVGTKDDKTAARLNISLTGRPVQKLSGTLADVLGSHTWHGTLCDGTNVSVAFKVVDDGTGNGKVTYDPATFATGATATAKPFKRGFVAIFDGKRAAVLVWLKKNDDGTWKLAVGSFVGHWCKGTTIPNPTVNTPVSPDATKGPDGKWHWGFWGWGRHGFGHHPGGDGKGH